MEELNGDTSSLPVYDGELFEGTDVNINLVNILSNKIGQKKVLLLLPDFPSPPPPSSSSFSFSPSLLDLIFFSR